jgi:hypothetical protein
MKNFIESFKEKKLTRREFLNLLVIVGALAFIEIHTTMSKFKEWLYLIIKEFFKENKDLKFKELGINSPFIYLKEEKWEEYFNLLLEIQKIFNVESFRIRIFISDDFERNLGEYNFEVLEKIFKFYNFLKEKGVNFVLEIDLIDCYSIGNSLKYNPIYGSHPPSSPYNTSKDLNGYKNFFTDERLKGFFIKRVEEILKYLREKFGNENLIISIANEPEPPYSENEKRQILNLWYDFVLENIKNLLSPNWKIVSGLKDPRYLSKEFYERTGVMPTLHLYPFEFSPSEIEGIIKEFGKVYIQELGVPYRIFNFSNPLEKVLWKALLRWLNNQEISVWKIDFYEDGFDFSRIIPQDIS